MAKQIIIPASEAVEPSSIPVHETEDVPEQAEQAIILTTEVEGDTKQPNVPTIEV